MRTETQKMAFALNCQEIEKEGGDVLSFIQRNWPSYTPRGTWYNLQREYLHRQTHELTDGRPKEDKNVNDRREIAYALRDNYVESGDDIRAFLEDCGYADPSNGLASVKDWAKKNDPDCYEAIKDLTVRRTQKRTPPEKAKNGAQTGLQVSPTDDSPKKAEAPCRPPQQRAEAGSVTTCCAPARPSGVTVPDELPEPSSSRQVKPPEPVRKKPRVVEVETDLGSFRKEEGKIAFRRVDDGKDYKNQLKMDRKQWLQLAAEMNGVLEMLEEIEN